MGTADRIRSLAAASSRTLLRLFRLRCWLLLYEVSVEHLSYSIVDCDFVRMLDQSRYRSGYYVAVVIPEVVISANETVLILRGVTILEFIFNIYIREIDATLISINEDIH